ARSEIPVVAVALRPGKELEVDDLARVLESLLPEERPVVVRIVEEIPMTAGYRPLKAPLRRAGIDPEQVEGRLLWFDADADAFRALDPASYRELRVRRTASA